MATVVLTLRDMPNGAVSVDVQMKPRHDNGAAPATLAQKCGAKCLLALESYLLELGASAETDQAPSQSPERQ